MDPRERGIAHVNIFWCLVPMVLMFGAAGYGYMKHTEADEAKQATVNAKAAEKLAELALNERDRQLTDLTKVLGNAGKFLDPIVAIEGYTVPSKWTSPEKLNVAFQSFKTKLNLSNSLSQLDEIFNSAATQIRQRSDTIAGLEKQLRDSRGELKTSRDSVATVRDELNGKISNLEGSLNAERTKMDQQVRQSTTELADARSKTTAAREERDKIRKDSEAAAAAFANEKMILNARIANATNKLKVINSPQDPDGRVLESSPSTRLAWIDIGGRDMVKAGLTFRLLGPTKTGFKLKGHGTVVRVENDRAELKVVELVNELDPIVRGDVVANDLFSPDLKLNVFLLGRFGTPYSKGEIKRIMETMGNTVSDKMDPTVDLVIVGRQPIGGEDSVKIEDTEEYKTAAHLGTNVVTLYKIRDFLKL